jgi:ABC-type glycerol-3-phosphate transport system permease component
MHATPTQSTSSPVTTRFMAEGIKYAVLIACCCCIAIPVYLMLVISLKDTQQFVHAPFLPTWPLHWENYRLGWGQVLPFIARTAVVAFTATLLAVIMGSLCAFIFSQYEFAGKRVAYSYIFALMMIPGILNLVPLYVLVTWLDNLLRAWGQQAGVPLRLLNTVWVLILPAAAGGQIFMIYVLRTFFDSQPRALFEAARIDGAGLLAIWRHVALPLSKPIIGTLAVLNIVALWNDYIWPLLVLQQDHYTVSLGLKYLEGQQYVQYGPLMAGYVISAIPLLLLLGCTMRLFIRGLAAGAIKM